MSDKLVGTDGVIGSVGTYAAEVDKDGTIKVSLGAQINLLDELAKLAEKTATPLDDMAIAWVKGMLAKLP